MADQACSFLPCPLPNEHAYDLLALEEDRRCREPDSICGHLDEALLPRPSPVWIPTGLQRVRYEALLFIDFIPAAITDECFKSGGLFIHAAAHEIRTGESWSIRSHDTDAHITVLAVRDNPGGALAHWYRHLDTSG